MTSTVYCTAPWKNIAVMPNGDVRTCCIGRTALGNLNDHPIEQILDSEELKSIKQDLTEGIRNKNCLVCYSQEDTVNYASLKEHFLKYYPLASLNDTELNSIDVRWNNKCNLACQYCDPAASSSWETKLGLPLSSVNKPYQDVLLEWVLERISGVREIMLQGGETMLMKQNYKLFAHAPKNCKFSIVTNLSYDFEHLPCIDDLLSRPRDNIFWNISADNTGQQFEYVRNGASWNQLVKNIEFLVKHWPNTVTLNLVYSILSATEVDKTYQTFSELGIHKLSFLPILNSNIELSIDSMPDAVRAVCKDSLSRMIDFHKNKFGEDRHLYPISGSELIHASLTMPPKYATISKDKFNQKIKQLDSWASVGSFRELWPELAELLDQTLN